MNILIDPILSPLQYEFMVRALVVTCLVGLVCPIIGAYVITRNLSFMGDALAHGVMPGLAVGVLLGISPLIVAVPTGIGFAVIVVLLSRRTGISEDASIGIMFAGMFALGLLILSTADNINVSVEDILLGQALAVSRQDMYLTAGLAVISVAVLGSMHRQLVFASFDPIGARVSGLSVTAMNGLLMSVMALVIVLSVQAVGVVMVLAMLVAPASVAYLLARRFSHIMALGSLVGLVSALSGLYMSFHLNLPTGPSMSLVAVGIFIVVALLRRRRGV